MPSTTTRLGLDVAAGGDLVSAYPTTMAQAMGILDYAAVLRPVATIVNATLVPGQVTYVNAGARTMTLPAATIGTSLGVVSALGMSGSAPTTITGSGGALIFGQGANFVSSILLGTPGSKVWLLADGTNWTIIQGQQDSGWVALTPGSGWSVPAPSYFTPAYRVTGDTLAFSGAFAGSSVSGITTLTTVPASFAPQKTVVVVASTLGGWPTATANVQVANTGTVTCLNAPTGTGQLVIDNIAIRLS